MRKAGPFQGSNCLRPSCLVSVVLYAAAFLAALMLAGKITLYCDDYFYGSVFRDGWQAFWEMTKWHYTEFNGRAFVHFIGEIVMSFGTKVFTPLFPVMLSGVFLLGGRLQSREISWNILLISGAAGIMSVLALPVLFLNSSLLWMSAAFNYLFPLCVIFPALWLEMREGKGRGLFALTLFLSFLSGATTEQSGLAAVVCLGGWGGLAWLRKKRTFWQGILPGFCAGVGYLTVIFAPGTWVRIGNETGGGLLHILDPGVLPARFQLALNFTTGADGLPLLIVGFALLTGVHALLRGPRPLLAGLIVAPVYWMLHSKELFFLGNVLAVLYLFVAAAAYLWRPEYTVRGLFVLGMLASQLVMMFSGTVGFRTALPGILLLLTVCASLLAECLEPLPFWVESASCGALAAVLFVLFLPTYRGYAANAVVHVYNEAQLRNPDSDLAVLNLDLNGTYRYIMFCDSLVYLENSIIFYEAEDKRISYTASDRQVAGLSDGVQYGLPVLVEDGEPIFPILNTMRMCGGDSGWNTKLGGTTAEMDGKAYVFHAVSSEAQAYDPETEEPIGEPVYADVRVPYYTHYVSGAALRELFGITWTYDQEENIYYVHTGGRP